LPTVKVEITDSSTAESGPLFLLEKDLKKKIEWPADENGSTRMKRQGQIRASGQACLSFECGIQSGILGRGEGLNLQALGGGKRLDDVDGLIDSSDFVIFVLEPFNILQGNLLAPQVPQNEIEIEEEHSQILDRVLAERSLAELLKSMGHVLGQLLRVSGDGHISSF